MSLFYNLLDNPTAISASWTTLTISKGEPPMCSQSLLPTALVCHLTFSSMWISAECCWMPWFIPCCGWLLWNTVLNHGPSPPAWLSWLCYIATRWQLQKVHPSLISLPAYSPYSPGKKICICILSFVSILILFYS